MFTFCADQKCTSGCEFERYGAPTVWEFWIIADKIAVVTGYCHFKQQSFVAAKFTLAELCKCAFTFAPLAKVHVLLQLQKEEILKEKEKNSFAQDIAATKLSFAELC